MLITAGSRPRSRPGSRHSRLATKPGRIDLEAVEMGVRTAMHHAGASALHRVTAILLSAPCASRHSVPAGVPPKLPIKLRLTRFSPLRTVQLSASYYLCPGCHNRPIPCRVRIGLENQILSWGSPHQAVVVLRRRHSINGREADESSGRPEVTTKEWSRTARAIGADIAGPAEQPTSIAVGLPIVVGQSVPILYLQWTRTGFRW